MTTLQEKPPSSFPWPPVLYAVAILSALAIQAWVYPLPWLPGTVGGMAFMAGLLLIAAAVFIDVRTFAELRRHKTTILPTKAASRLVTSGPFSFSRNPIYLSNTMLTVGLGLALGNAWLLPAAFLAAYAVTKLAIEGEEKHLARKFGTAWHHYAKKVRRWL